MTYGVSSALGSFILGKLLGLINYNIAVTGNVTLNSGIIFFLFIWKKQSQHMVLFLIPLIWGFCNGAWIAISCSKFTCSSLANYITCYVVILATA